VVNGLSLGLATMLVMMASNAAVSPVRRWVPSEIRIPVFILIIAALVTVIDLSMHAYMNALHGVLGIFIPLIVTNCIVLARVEAFAAKHPVGPSALDGLMMGLGLTLVLTLLGAMRELVGKGTLLSGLDLALGPAAKEFMLTVIPDYPGFLLAVLPPGAFLGLALLIAARNWVGSRRTAAQSAPPLALASGH
jgi:electron transport complex protein RnfE